MFGLPSTFSKLQMRFSKRGLKISKIRLKSKCLRIFSTLVRKLRFETLSSVDTYWASKKMDNKLLISLSSFVQFLLRVLTIKTFNSYLTFFSKNQLSFFSLLKECIVNYPQLCLMLGRLWFLQTVDTNLKDPNSWSNDDCLLTCSV